MNELRLPSDVASTSCHALNVGSRTRLRLKLTPKADHYSSRSFPQDWQGLADLMDFDYQQIRNFETKSDPVDVLLDAWTTKQGATVGKLWDYLVELELFDLVEDPIFKDTLIQDVERYRKRQEERSNSSCYTNEQPLQVNDVSPSQPESEYAVDELEGIVIDDVDGQTEQLFDAFVCYTYSDLPFVKQLLHMLEGVYGLKLCVLERDLLPGCSTYTVTAHLIAKRCKKILMVLSPEFIRSPECDFQLKFAQSLAPGSRSKKLIPVLYKVCSIPDILNHITLVDFTKGDLATWFWKRLAASLKHTPVIRSTPVEDHELRKVTLNIDPTKNVDDFRCSLTSLPGCESMSSRSGSEYDLPTSSQDSSMQWEINNGASYDASMPVSSEQPLSSEHMTGENISSRLPSSEPPPSYSSPLPSVSNSEMLAPASGTVSEQLEQPRRSRLHKMRRKIQKIGGGKKLKK